MSIPAPYLFRLRVAWTRKIGVSLLLLSGVFMIATALVRAVGTLAAAPSVINTNRWGFRETGVGMIAVNAAVLMPLLKRRFWKYGAYVHRAHAEPEQLQEGRQRRPSGAGLKALAELWVWTISAPSHTASTFSRNTQRGRGSGGSQGTVQQGTVLDEIGGAQSTQFREAGREETQSRDVEAGPAERYDIQEVATAGSREYGAASTCEVVDGNKS